MALAAHGMGTGGQCSPKATVANSAQRPRIGHHLGYHVIQIYLFGYIWKVEAKVPPQALSHPAQIPRIGHHLGSDVIQIYIFRI